MPTVDYKERLLESLKDPTYAAGYVTACFDEGPDVFLLGIRDVAEAHGGLGRLAERASLNRENLYDMLSRRGNPRLKSLRAILDALGFDVDFTPKDAARQSSESSQGS